MYSISILHPSRNRPKQADETIKKWLSKTVYPEQIEYILSVDKSDKDLRRYAEVSERNGIKLLVGNNRTAIEAINRAAKKSTGNLLIVVSDDFDAPYRWDESLLKELEGKEDYLVKTQDGIQPTLVTLPILDRKYYNRFGYVYNESYKHMHCDEEMTCVAFMLGRIISLPLVFKHNHYSVGGMKKDVVNLKNDATFSFGKKMLAERKKTNFGLNESEIVMSHEDIKWR